MKLTTKRNRWYFWRELFSYMIPMILIVWTIDVFYHFIQCPLHPEWSAPCDVNWVLAAIYWVFLIIIIILAVISASMLKKVKRQIENEFLESTTNAKEIEDKAEELKVEDVKKVKITKPRKVIVKSEPINLKKTTKKEAKKDTKKETKTWAKKKTPAKKTSAKK